LLLSVNQNVPTCVASGNNNGCRPISSYANNSQYSSAGDSTYHGLHVSLAQRSRGWGQYRVSYTLSKAMNNVGEFFFSSPIDPTDIAKDWGRADNDQRHRLVLNAAAQKQACRSAACCRRTSAPPFKHHVWRHHGPGHDGTADRRRRISFRRNSVDWTRRVSALRRAPWFHVSRRPAAGSSKMLAERPSTDRSRQRWSRAHQFRRRRVSTSPSPTYNQITAVGEPRSFQFGARTEI
jgi:hypothetical protein